MGDGRVTSDQCGDLALLGIDEKREKDRLVGAEVRRWRAKLERKLLLWLLRRPVKDGLMQRSGFQIDSFDATTTSAGVLARRARRVYFGAMDAWGRDQQKGKRKGTRGQLCRRVEVKMKC